MRAQDTSAYAAQGEIQGETVAHNEAEEDNQLSLEPGCC